MNHPVVSHEEWLAARRALLEKEKEFTRQGDELSRQVRELPWEVVQRSICLMDPTAKYHSPISSTAAASW